MIKIPKMEGTRIDREFYSNGNISFEIPRNKNGQYHGIVKRYYYGSGNISRKVSYKNDKIHGLSIGWNKGGVIAFETPYKNDIEFGARIKFIYEYLKY